MLDYMCSCFRLPEGILTTTDKIFNTTEADGCKDKEEEFGVEGHIEEKEKGKENALTQQPTISIESNQELEPELEAREPPEYKCGMEEMTFVGEVIRDDFVTPISQDITHIHHNIIELALRKDADLLQYECIAPYFEDGFARMNDEANTAHSLHQLQQKYEQLHPELMRGAGDSDISQSITEKVANTMSSPKGKRTKIYTRGIRAQGTKKTGKNGTMRISEGEEKQKAMIRVRRRRSHVGSE
jgi:hypothetical protein